MEWREAFLTREPLCRHCKAKGIVTLAAELDHIIPLEKDGGYEDSNICPLCVECHKVKTAIDRGYVRRAAIGADGWPVE